MSEAASKQRTRNYFKQIKGTALYKAGSVGASFLAIPTMINYLGEEQFGVWSTLLTIMSWVILFDLGIGNGLRNKVAESLAKNDSQETRNYIASGYTLMGLIAIALWGLLTATSYFIPWQIVFNTQAISELILRETIQISTLFIVLNFWIGIITALLGAIQKNSVIALGQLVSNCLILILVVLISKTTTASISNLALVYGLSLVIANISLSAWFFKTHHEIKPSLYIKMEHIDPLLSVGIQFFIIQLAVLVIFTSDKILITQIFGPSYVTQYEIVFKLFSVVTFTHALISAPLWSAYTDAYHRGDQGWIRTMLRKQLIIFGGIVIATCLLALLALPIINLWIGYEVIVSDHLILVMAFFVIISAWNNIYAMLVNGLGKIKPQLCTSIIAMIINIPLSTILAKYTPLGVSGIVVGTICSLSLAAIVLPLQTLKLIGVSEKKYD